MAAKKKQAPKIFVLDTSVILHDHHAITNFEEHDVAIPITVLEELDNFKKGNDTIHYEAREFIRFLDRLSGQFTLQDWIPLNGPKKGRFCVIMNERSDPDATQIFGDDKPDHRIINAALHMQSEYRDRKVILVSKDVNLRLKAKSLNLAAEDYETGKIKNLETLYTGISHLENIPEELFDTLYAAGEFAADLLFDTLPSANQYFIFRNMRKSGLAYFNARSGMIEKVEKRQAYGIKPKNAEQTFAMHAVLQEEVKLVTIQGVAGTGKTLLALACALEQKMRFRQIYLARPIVPLSNKDIGYLPGDIKSKLNPYMEPLWDNLKYIQSQYSENAKESGKINEMLENEKLVVSPLAYIRGRSLSHIMFIVDEAQNLTPHEVKTIITRAGEGTKIVFTGDIHQIDTPYLDAQSNGLSYLIDRVRDQALCAHITLEKGERSDLANLANVLL
jgi:PhoH-like ATPase